MQLKLPKGENTITTGNLISAVCVVFIGSGIWFSLNRDVRDNTRDILELFVEQRSQDMRIRALELNAGRNEEKLLNIITILEQIQRELEARP